MTTYSHLVASQWTTKYIEQTAPLPHVVMPKPQTWRPIRIRLSYYFSNIYDIISLRLVWEYQTTELIPESFLGGPTSRICEENRTAWKHDKTGRCFWARNSRYYYCTPFLYLIFLYLIIVQNGDIETGTGLLIYWRYSDALVRRHTCRQWNDS